MQREIRAYKKRNAASDTNLRSMLRDQSKGHFSFLAEMGDRVKSLENLSTWGATDPLGPRESRERTKARLNSSKGVAEQGRDYNQAIKSLQGELDNRGPQEWTTVIRPSNDAIVSRRKAKGIAILTQQKEAWEGILEGIQEREGVRVLAERKELKRQGREVELRLNADKTRLLQGMSATMQRKKAELDDIQARVNGRGSGRPDHPEFVGYASAGYTAVEKSQSRLRDHAAERADKDADHAGSAAKLLCLSMPLQLRNRIVAANPPRKAASLIGTGINNPMEWSDMNWTQKWSLLSCHAPQRAIQKAQEKAGVDSQGMDMSATMSPSEQRTLSPRTLGMATTQ